MEMGKPHVIIIMADQLRYDALGEHTPNINHLRDESAQFERAYCASPLCVPARGAFFTGKYPNVTGSLHNAKIPQEKQKGMVAAEHVTLYDLMENGWDSWHVGKMDLRTERQMDRDPQSRTSWLPLEPRYYQFLDKHGKKRPGGEGFRGFVPELVHGKHTRIGRVSTPRVGRFEETLDYFYDGFILNDALHAVKHRNRNQPFLLNTMFFAPHPPLAIPEPWFSKVKEVTLPDNVGRWGDNQSPLQLHNLTGIMGANKAREDWYDIWRVYLGFVALLDDCIGRLLEALKREGLYDDALILFTSDHGEMLGSHRLWQKMCLYEESIRTPLFFKFPKGQETKKRVINDNVSSIDILPTLSDYLQLEKPCDCSGQSLLPLFSGEPLDRERIFVQYDGNGSSGNFSRGVIENDHKLIVDMFKDELFIELYNIADDREEMTNLSFHRENQPLIERLLDHLRTHMKTTGDTQTLPIHAYQRFIKTYGAYRQ